MSQNRGTQLSSYMSCGHEDTQAIKRGPWAFHERQGALCQHHDEVFGPNNPGTDHWSPSESFARLLCTSSSCPWAIGKVDTALLDRRQPPQQTSSHSPNPLFCSLLPQGIPAIQTEMTPLRTRVGPFLGHCLILFPWAQSPGQGQACLWDFRAPRS